MAKKKKTQKKKVRKQMSKTKVKPTAAESSQFALRLHSEIYDQLKRVSGEAGISMNQLVQGLCEAAMANVHVGEPVLSDDGLVKTNQQAGCVFFGELEELKYRYKGKEMTESQLCMKLGGRELEPEDWMDPDIESLGRKGTVWFGLDYSGRGYRKY